MARIRFYYQGDKDGGWRTAGAVTALGKQIEAAWPKRHGADGTVAGSGHAGWPASDHGIDPGGLVRAIDCGIYENQGRVLCEQLRQSRDPRLRYIIHDRRMLRTYPKPGTVPWEWSWYTGSNPHAGHVHVSVQRSSLGDDGRPWNINLGATIGDDAMLTPQSSLEAIADQQRWFNQLNLRDGNGDPLVIDGVWGTKTQQVVDAAYASLGWMDRVGSPTWTLAAGDAFARVVPNGDVPDHAHDLKARKTGGVTQ